jgi:hypothetical protein
MSVKRAIKENVECEERRNEKDHVEFPLVDEKGNYIRFCRRKNEDQTTGVLVTRISISKEEFAEYFEANKDDK